MANTQPIPPDTFTEIPSGMPNYQQLLDSLLGGGAQQQAATINTQVPESPDLGVSGATPAGAAPPSQPLQLGQAATPALPGSGAPAAPNYAALYAQMFNSPIYAS